MIGPWRGNDPKPPRQPRPRFSPPTPTNYNQPDNPTGQEVYAAGKRLDHRDRQRLDHLDVDWEAAGAELRRMRERREQYQLGEAMARDVEDHQMWERINRVMKAPRPPRW